jgi:hypothetical protein
VNAEIANDAPTKTGGGASGTWGIAISGNAATASTASALSATTWQRITGSGITQGSYGSISVSGATGGYIGINFSNHNLTWMSDNQSSVSFGVYKNNNAWAFYFNNTGSLVVGSVPASSISGTGTGSVGTYAFLRGTSGAAGPGATVAGSSLWYTDTNRNQSYGQPGGTWRLMGGSTNIAYPSVWLRIS